MSWFIAHPQFILAPLAAAGWFGFRAWQASGFKLPTLPSLSTKKADTSRLALLSHLDAAYEGFRAIGCAEGMAGVRALVPHVYQEHGGEHV